MLLPAGEIVATEWFQLGQHRPPCEPLDHIVMPDHFHGVLRVIDEAPGSLWRAMSCFKGEVTKAARQLGLVGREPMWARGYYERVVRSDVELCRIQRYIADNPRRWMEKVRAAQGNAATGI
ncbi:MAG: transposase [Gemmatimonadales bacterium]